MPAHLSSPALPIWQQTHQSTCSSRVESPSTPAIDRCWLGVGDEGRGDGGVARRREGGGSRRSGVGVGAVRGVQAAAPPVRGQLRLRALLPARGAAQVRQRAQGVRGQQCQQAAPGMRARPLLYPARLVVYLLDHALLLCSCTGDTAHCFSHLLFHVSSEF